MEKNYKKILLIAATHGNERIGIEVINRLAKQKLDVFFDFLVANPKALEKNVRFVDIDLNRSYPGKQKSKKYEERLAAKNIKLAKKYKYVIDLHEASSGTEDFIIIPRHRLNTAFPLDPINLGTVLIWPDPKGPLGSCLKNTIELEFGMKGKNRKIIINRAVSVVGNFILSLDDLNGRKTAGNRKRKEIFEVYGKMNLQEAAKYRVEFQDFKKVKIKDELFYPLLVDQYKDLGIAFYKMKRTA
ncbi:MAG: succinylglutamate desuccinylase/aspartoacylase family protein [Candidatus Moranbacteria bacterium]|nr:succinylglutamate desuccinylase/aspartoacylase family protein [Candidatus Moranbacteria bacterium]